jgi:DNA-binding winged helix-turn-helix (wHTH) protein
MRFRTDTFDFDAATGEIRRDGSVHRLEPQPSALLALLMSRPGGLVIRAEAIHALWGDQTSVNFQEGLDYTLRQIRLALGDRARPARYVETIPRRGYRFIAPVHQPEAAVVRERPVRRQVWTAAALAVTLLVGAAALVERRPNRHHEIAVTILRAVHDRIF